MDNLSDEFVKYLVDRNKEGEGDRQLTLMALAHLAVERPGFDYALNLLACRIDNVENGRAKLYDQFKALHEKAITQTLDFLR